MLLISVLMISGEALKAYMEKWVLYSSSVCPPFPTFNHRTKH